jgi:hypothetical protein
MKTLTNILGMKKVARGMGFSLAGIILAGSLLSGCSIGDAPRRPDHSKGSQTTTTQTTDGQTGTSDTPYNGTTDIPYNGTIDVLVEGTSDIANGTMDIPYNGTSDITNGTTDIPEGTVDVPPVNQSPITTITRNFGNGLTGTVDYTITANDPDGYVGTLDFLLNGNQHFVGSNPTGINPATVKFSVPIISGTNDFQASATDNLGLWSGTSDSTFYSPTEAEARAKIEEILDARKANGEFSEYFIDDTTLYQCGGTYKTIKVDYRIVTKDNHSRIINYISSADNPDTELENKTHLDKCNTDASLYMRLLPNSEVNSRTNNFIEYNVKPLQ